MKNTLRYARCGQTLGALALAAASLLLIVGNSVCHGQDDSSSNVWHIGNLTVRAEFVRLTDDGVVLRRLSDLKEAEIPLSQLSFADQLRALKLGKPDAFNKPLPKAETGVVEVGPIKTLDIEAITQSPFSPDMTLTQWVDVVQRELEQGNGFVFWHALTPKMQSDVEEVFAEAMQKIAPLRGQVRRLVQSLATIVREKKKFIFGHPLIAGQPEIKETLDPIWPELAKLLTALADDQIWDESNFEQGQLANWLAKVVATVGPAANEFGEALQKHPELQARLEELQAASQQPQTATVNVSFDLEQVDIKVVNETATSGTIEVHAPDRDAETIEMVKVDGHWLPKDLVDEWDNALAEAKKGLADFDTQGLNMVNFFVSGIAGQFEMMAKAKTQREFNEAAQALMELAGGMGPMGPGGPGGGPPGGFGPTAGGAPARPGQPSGFGGSRPGQPSGFGGSRPGQPSGFGGSRPGQPSGFGGSRPGQPSGFGGSRPGQPSGFGSGPGSGNGPSTGQGAGRPGQPSGFDGGGTGGSSSAQ